MQFKKHNEDNANHMLNKPEWEVRQAGYYHSFDLHQDDFFLCHIHTLLYNKSTQDFLPSVYDLRSVWWVGELVKAIWLRALLDVGEEKAKGGHVALGTADSWWQKTQQLLK